MHEPVEPFVAHVQRTFRQLCEVAATLNTASDNLGSSITSLDSALRKLKLGIESWLTFRTFHADPSGSPPHDDIGFAKIGGKWGLALRSVDGSEDPSEPPDIELWPFNDAPRMLRIRAIDRIPDLLEQLLADAKDAVEKINRQAQAVDVLTTAIKKATEPDTNGAFVKKVSEAFQARNSDASVLVQMPETGRVNTPMMPPPKSGRNS
jgi:hypothetical protein